MIPETSVTGTAAFNEKDIETMKGIQRKEMIRLVRRYGLFFLLLAYACLRGQGKINSHARTDANDLHIAMMCFFSFFAVSLGCFVFRDYRVGLRQFGKELNDQQKNVIKFSAR